MGLFSRKEGSASRKPAAKPRPSVSSEAQAAELRVRARRRLAGAVALVLAAVVVLPMLLDAEPQSGADKITVKIPRQDSPFQPNLSDPAPVASNGAAGNVSSPQALPSAEMAAAAATANAPDAPPSTVPDAVVVPPAAVKPEVKKTAELKPVPATQKEKEAKETKPTKETARTDDGSRALALLEGRAPSTSATANTAETNKASAVARGPTKANFVVQAVSLDVQSDAHAQRDKLVAQGVSNAYVDGPAEVSGKQYYRVRAGPFATKESAQAAQTRLRTLGFGNAYIIPQ